MKLKNLFKPLLILGTITTVATPLALISCDSSSFSSYDKELLVNQQVKSIDQSLSDNLFDLISGASKKTENYIVFVGSTACPTCNSLLTGRETRLEYLTLPEVSTYNGPFLIAARTLNSNKIAKTFLHEEKAPGFEMLPWLSIRNSDREALIFRGVLHYFSKQMSPMIIAVKNGQTTFIEKIGDERPGYFSQDADTILDYFTAFFKS